MAFERCEIVWPASKWFYDGRKEPVTAESTDEEIAATAKLMEQEALAVGVRLEGTEKHLRSVRDELSDRDDCDHDDECYENALEVEDVEDAGDLFEVFECMDDLFYHGPISPPYSSMDEPAVMAHFERLMAEDD